MTRTAKRRHGESLSERLYFPSRNTKSTRKFLNRLIIHRKLVEIVAKLRPLSEQHGLIKFLNNVDHTSILNGFVQDLAYAITDYQVGSTNSFA